MLRTHSSASDGTSTWFETSTAVTSTSRDPSTRSHSGPKNSTCAHTHTGSYHWRNLCIYTVHSKEVYACTCNCCPVTDHYYLRDTPNIHSNTPYHKLYTTHNERERVFYTVTSANLTTLRTLFFAFLLLPPLFLSCGGRHTTSPPTASATPAHKQRSKNTVHSYVHVYSMYSTRDNVCVWYTLSSDLIKYT